MVFIAFPWARCLNIFKQEEEIAYLSGHEVTKDLNSDLIALSCWVLWQFDHRTSHSLQLTHVLPGLSYDSTDERLWNSDGSLQTDLIIACKSLRLHLFKYHVACLENAKKQHTVSSHSRYHSHPMSSRCSALIATFINLHNSIITRVFFLIYNLTHHRMFTGKVWTDVFRLLQESNLAMQSATSCHKRNYEWRTCPRSLRRG